MYSALPPPTFRGGHKTAMPILLAAGSDYFETLLSFSSHLQSIAAHAVRCLSYSLAQICLETIPSKVFFRVYQEIYVCDFTNYYCFHQ